MPHIKWYVVQRLTDRDDMLPKCVRDAGLVHYVWISPRKVDDHRVRAKD
jgi:hypothetical protein